MPRKRPSRFTTFQNVNVTRKEEDGHFVTSHNNCDGNFAFTLPSSISEETWLESLKDISSKISLDNNADQNNNKSDNVEIVSSAIQKRFPQLDKRIPLFVARVLTSGLPSDWKKDGHVQGNVASRVEKGTGEGAFGSNASNEMNQRSGINDVDLVEDIIFRELVSDLGDLTNFDREESQSGKTSFDQDENFDWISDLDDDEVDDQFQTGKRVAKLPNKPAKIKKRKPLAYFFPCDTIAAPRGYGGLATSSHTVLLAGSVSGIDWKIKRYETTDCQMDVLLKPDHEPNMVEIMLVIAKVVSTVFEKKYAEDIDQHRIKVSLVPRGLEPSTVWIGSPRSCDLTDLITNVSNKMRLYKNISLHFGITLRFSRSDENEVSMMEKVMKFVETKKSIINVKNDDFRGLGRSIVLAMCHPSRENHPYWSSMRKSGARPGRLLERLTRNLHTISGVPVKKHYNCTDFEAFQRVIPPKYRLVILGDPWTQKIVYAGPLAQSNIYVFNFEDLYFAVIKAAGFYSSSYFCEKCLKRYENLGHICKEKDLQMMQR